MKHNDIPWACVRAVASQHLSGTSSIIPPPSPVRLTPFSGTGLQDAHPHGMLREVPWAGGYQPASLPSGQQRCLGAGREGGCSAAAFPLSPAGKDVAKIFRKGRGAAGGGERITCPILGYAASDSHLKGRRAPQLDQ